jgi:ribosomal protein S6--L-glutamate ligase
MNVVIFAYTPDTYATSKLDACLRGRGHRVVLASPLDCALDIRTDDLALLYQGKPLRSIDVVLLRGLTYYENGSLVPRIIEAAMAAPLVNAGALCFNAPASKRVATNKLATAIALASAGIPTPRTALTWSADAFPDVVAMLGEPLIIKMTDGTSGIGVVRSESAQSARSMFDVLRSHGQPFLMQSYIDDAEARHLRVLVVGGRAIGALHNTPPAGEFRANMRRGAAATAIALSPECERLALAAANTIGLDIAGVDIIDSPAGPHVLEVNSVPGFRAIDEQCGIDASLAVVEFIEQRHEQRRDRPLVAGQS